AYEERLGAEMGRLLGDKALLGDYPRGVFAALDLSIERCPPGTTARRLLEGAAVFAPEAVPLAWATEAAGLDAEDGAASKALKELGQFGLVAVDEGGEALSMHRLVRLRIREQVDKGVWKQASERAAACVADWLQETVDVTRMPEVEARRAHVDEVLGAAEAAESKYVAITIADALATHLQYRAELLEARSLFERAVAEAERLEPADPRVLGKQLSKLAMLHEDLGQAAEARGLLERALQIYEKLYAPEHSELAPLLSNLAMVYKVQGNAAEARSLLTRALMIIETNYGPEHPSVAIVLSNLAMAQRALNQATEARPLMARALDIAEKTNSPDHPTVALRLSNLATVQLDLGHATEARPLLQRALEINEAIYGQQHPIIAGDLSNLAMAHRALGQTSEARSLLERAFRIAEKVFQPGHPTRTLIAENLDRL
ncbi:MAG: tetratricopeptide repeat protein, partial [Byssovorax sp.]